MGFDLIGGRRLVLAGGGMAWAWLLAGALAAALLVLLYRYERRLVPRRAGLILLGLRLAAAMALVGFLFEPIAERTVTEALRGRVVVGVDLSDSMNTPDPGRPEADRRKLAQLLELSPAEPPEQLPRREVARRLVGGDWMKRIAEGREVEPIGFARGASPGTAQGLADLMRGASPIEGGGATDWSPVLSAGLRGGGEGVIGVVLLTDGRQNAPGDPSGPLVDRLASRGIPIYPVLIGTSRPPRDAAIAAIKASENVYKGDTATLEATVKIDAPPGTELPVVLERPGAEPIRKTAVATADGSRPIVAFRVPMEAVGAQELSVRVGPLEGDARPDNDRRSVGVQVLDDKARVLLVDGEARWEFRYLRNALARDPRVAVEAVVFRQPAAEGASATFARSLPAVPEPTAADRAPADPLGAFDAIILGDVDPEDLPAEAWDRLDRYVAGRGGTLIVNAGPRGWPALLESRDAARRMAPVADPRPAAFDPQATDPDRPALPAGIALQIPATSPGDSWPMLQFAAEADRNRSTWAAPPRPPGPSPAGPARRHRARHRVRPGSGGRCRRRRDRRAALRPGQGAVGRHRRHPLGATRRRRLPPPVLGSGGPLGRIGQAGGRQPARPVRPRQGPDPRRRTGPDPRPVHRGSEGGGPGTLVAARIFREGGTTGEPAALVPLRARGDLPGAFEGASPTLPPGRYVVRLDAPELADALNAEGAIPEAPLEIAPRETSERVELAANRDPGTPWPRPPAARSSPMPRPANCPNC
ncbi:MAG: hypothetical protein U0800_07645 [Isosphaeraceae bacterium]